MVQIELYKSFLIVLDDSTLELFRWLDEHIGTTGFYYPEQRLDMSYD